jgi:hypothetical protein
VTVTTRPRIWPLSFFEDFTYALANFAVISARDGIDSPLSMPVEDHRFAGILT